MYITKRLLSTTLQNFSQINNSFILHKLFFHSAHNFLHKMIEKKNIESRYDIQKRLDNCDILVKLGKPVCNYVKKSNNSIHFQLIFLHKMLVHKNIFFTSLDFGFLYKLCKRWFVEF